MIVNPDEVCHKLGGNVTSWAGYAPIWSLIDPLNPSIGACGGAWGVARSGDEPGTVFP